MLAVSYMDNLTFGERVSTTTRVMESSIVCWNIENPQNPVAELKLWSPVDITVFEVQPSNPHYIVAGTYNGQVLAYNTSTDAQRIAASSDKEPKTLKYKAISTPDQSHKGPVTDIRFLPQQVGYRRSGERRMGERLSSAEGLCVLHDGGL